MYILKLLNAYAGKWQDLYTYVPVYAFINGSLTSHLCNITAVRLTKLNAAQSDSREVNLNAKQLGRSLSSAAVCWLAARPPECSNCLVVCLLSRLTVWSPWTMPEMSND